MDANQPHDEGSGCRCLVSSCRWVHTCESWGCKRMTQKTFMGCRPFRGWRNHAQHSSRADCFCTAAWGLVLGCRSSLCCNRDLYCPTRSGHTVSATLEVSTSARPSTAIVSTAGQSTPAPQAELLSPGLPGKVTSSCPDPDACVQSLDQSIAHLQHGAGCVSKEILYLVSP